jgi:hypothetical protein
MKDPLVQKMVDELKANLENVNTLMRMLQENNVEVRIEYQDKKGDEPQRLRLWRLVQHNDYL